MAKIHFYHGVMASSKSASLCINAYNLNRTGNKYEVLKPATDNRDSQNEIVSRIGLRTPALALPNLDNYTPKRGTQFILIDEVQFFTPKDIDKLFQIADNSKITIFCYGLVVDSNGDMFPAAQRLFAMNAEKHEIETVCEMPGCVNSASHHLRFDGNGDVVRGGTQVSVGADQYKSVCREHFNSIYYNQKSFNLLQYMRNQRIQKTK
nr:thymidine kinase [Candidatus Enterousia merdequi]